MLCCAVLCCVVWCVLRILDLLTSSPLLLPSKSLTCEMISADSIALANKKTGAGGKPPPANQCQAANEVFIHPL